jgi:hypothetical protein
MFARATRFLAPLVNLLFVACIGALLLVPALGLVRNAMRAPAAFGDLWPAGASVTSFPAAVDQFVAAQHGLRDRMVRTNARLKALFGGESPRVAFGTEGFLFLKDGDVFSQATGQRLDRLGLGKLADLAHSLAEEAERGGGRFLFVVAPNKHTIYRSHLPVWARPEPAITERALLMEMLRERGIVAVDPTVELEAQSERTPVYWRGDTHWTQAGMIVGFDAMVAALGRPEQSIGMENVFQGQVAVEKAGDLVRIAGLSEKWPDVAPVLVGDNPFAAGGLKREQAADHEISGSYQVFHERAPAPAGPRVMVIGDSFTVGGFDRLFMRFAGAYLWTHHRHGKFDRGLIGQFKPDIVILETVERDLPAFQSAPNE